MKVWKVLGSRNRLPRDTIIFIAALSLSGYMLANGKARLFVLVVMAGVGWVTSFFIRKALDDRDEWLTIVYRALFERRGTYSLFDRPKGEGKR
jgi:hypothetical protein